MDKSNIILLGLIIISTISIVSAPLETGITPIPDKEFNSKLYQTIDTQNIKFELPITATHHWNNSGLDKYEIIISNFSTKGYGNYILKVSWDDKRYIKDKIRINYTFIQGLMNTENIKPYSIYSKTDLTFKNFKTETGKLEGYKYKLKTNISCQLDNKITDKSKCIFNVSYPIYSWKLFSNITLPVKLSFTAIDDIEITECGELTAGDYYLPQNLSFTGTCIVIGDSDINIDLNRKMLNSTGGGTAIDNSGGYERIKVFNGTLKNTEVGIWTDSYGDTEYYNITFTEDIIGVYSVFSGVDGRTDIYNNLFSNNTYGIYSIDGSDRLINATNNVFIGNPSAINYAVYTEGDGIILNNNQVYGLGIGSYGFYINSYYNKMNNNFFNNTLYGIYLGTVSGNNNITNNAINYSRMTPIYLAHSANNKIINNSIYSCTTYTNWNEGACIYLNGDSNNNLFSNNQIRNSSGYGIVLDISPSNNLFRDTNMTETSSQKTIKIGSNSINNTFLNFSYATEEVAGTSQLIRKWYYKAFVNDTDGNPVISNITANDVSANNYDFTLTSNSTGNTNQTEILEYINSNEEIVYTSYTITAVNSTYSNSPLSHAYNVTSNRYTPYDIFTFSLSCWTFQFNRYIMPPSCKKITSPSGIIT